MNENKENMYFIILISIITLMLLITISADGEELFKGVWLWCGYQIKNDTPYIITYTIKFDTPTKGMVTFADINKQEIKVYTCFVNEIHECIKVGKYNYKYQKIDKDLYYLTQFPCIDFENKTVDGEYNFYVLIKSDMFDKRVGEIDTFFNLMFSGGA